MEKVPGIHQDSEYRNVRSRKSWRHRAFLSP